MLEANTKMIKVENVHWNELEHDRFAMPYAGYLVLYSFSEEQFSEIDQQLAAACLTESATTFVRTALLDSDPDLDRVIIDLRMEASSDADALRLLSICALEAWMSCGKDATDLELVAAHLAYEPELEEAQKHDSEVTISDMTFFAERLDLSIFDEETSELRPTEPREIFYKARAACTEQR